MPLKSKKETNVSQGYINKTGMLPFAKKELGHCPKKHFMLELKKITKVYPIGDGEVRALRGIDICFRESEFVSVLGPSGCGKTTMLNILGGLDRATSGSLIINGQSTDSYADRNWDAYRNHSVGFVFQSYNLIPHQTILRNVELALTLAGVKKAERQKRAEEALKLVGLGDQLKKKPAELSGGQMQRVAIARAIVNDPDIILADEPTGALDSETSVQVMDILKEISKDRLVVMVTHNPDLAEKYSTRIIRMLDGEITDDSNPLSDSEIAEESERAKAKVESKTGKKTPSMSFATSFGLSLKNLITKKGRTALTAFAGSIGIIGIALILAVSQGTTSFISSVQEDALSSYPLSIQSQHADFSSLIETFVNSAESVTEHENDAVYQASAMYNMARSLTNIEVSQNDLKSFKKFIDGELEKEDSVLAKSLSSVRYSYSSDLNVYTKNVDGEIIKTDLSQMMRGLISKGLGTSAANQVTQGATGNSGFGGGANLLSMMSPGVGRSGIWQEMLAGTDGKLITPLLEEQYDVIYGTWPNDYNEIVIVVDENNEISDMTLYALGLKPESEMLQIIDAALNGNKLENVSHSWTYEEIANTDFRFILSSDCYSYDEAKGIYTDLRETDAGLKFLYDNAVKLKVSGIIRPSGRTISSMLTGTIGYTKALTEYIIEHTSESPAAVAQLEDSDKDIFTGLKFKPDEGEIDDAGKASEFVSHVESLSDTEKSMLFVRIKSKPSEEQVKEYVDGIMANVTREQIEEMMVQSVSAQTGMGPEELKEYVASMSDEDLFAYYRQALENNYQTQYAMQTAQQFMQLPPDQILSMFDSELSEYTDEELAGFYDEFLEFAPTSYEENLETLGIVDIDNPSGVNLYAATFADKDAIVAEIDKYNDGADETQKIKYTDYVGLIMTSVTVIIDAITYVLIAFVSVSLIVSAIMIGVITLISVQERTKEIGILRAIGASKANVSSLFNAETVIIGLISGVLGVAITYLLCIPIDRILQALTGLQNLKTNLTIPAAVTLILISVLLNLISGFIPSRSAAKKDPVVALRTE